MPIRQLVAAGAVVLMILPAAAQQLSPRVDQISQLILDGVRGRTYDDAFAASQWAENPFAIDAFALQQAANVRILRTDALGNDIQDGTLSVLLAYETPGGEFPRAEATPAIFPFALKAGAACYAGYVTGWPVPDTVVEVDLTGQPCHAVSVANIVAAAYRAPN